jgi:uncharacterized membrane protein YdfJ with MMPL/SSD domain
MYLSTTDTTSEGDRTMSNMTKIALSAAIILSAAFSALTAANAGTITQQARNAASSGVAAYDRDGSVAEGHWYVRR